LFILDARVEFLFNISRWDLQVLVTISRLAKVVEILVLLLFATFSLLLSLFLFFIFARLFIFCRCLVGRLMTLLGRVGIIIVFISLEVVTIFIAVLRHLFVIWVLLTRSSKGELPIGHIEVVEDRFLVDI
jgi:hypothetical protein